MCRTSRALRWEIARLLEDWLSGAVAISGTTLTIARPTPGPKTHSCAMAYVSSRIADAGGTGPAGAPTPLRAAFDGSRRLLPGYRAQNRSLQSRKRAAVDITPSRLRACTEGHHDGRLRPRDRAVRRGRIRRPQQRVHLLLVQGRAVMRRNSARKPTSHEAASKLPTTASRPRTPRCARAVTTLVMITAVSSPPTRRTAGTTDGIGRAGSGPWARARAPYPSRQAETEIRGSVVTSRIGAEATVDCVR